MPAPSFQDSCRDTLVNINCRSRAVALLIGTFALTISPVLIAQQPQQPAQPQQKDKAPAAEAVSFSGEFDSNGVRLTLEQAGSDVTGTLLLGDLPCALKGTVKDGMLSAQVTIETDVEEFTAKFEGAKLLVSDKDTTLTFERVKTDQPTRVSHPGGLDFVLPIGWSKRDMQGKWQFMPPKGIVKGNTAIIAEVQDWAHDKPITDPVALGMFRAGFKESLPTFDDIVDPLAIALGNDTGILMRLKGNTEELAKVHVNVYLRTIDKKIAVVMLIAEAEDIESADKHCRAILTDVVPPGAEPTTGPALTLTCPEGWKQQEAKTGITLYPPAKEGAPAPEDFVAIAEQPWAETNSFFDAMSADRVDAEVRIAFTNAKRVGELERLGASDSDGVHAIYQPMITPDDGRMLDVRLKKLEGKMVIQMWMGPKTVLESRSAAIASIFKSVALAPTASPQPDQKPEAK